MKLTQKKFKNGLKKTKKYKIKILIKFNEFIYWKKKLKKNPRPREI